MRGTDNGVLRVRYLPRHLCPGLPLPTQGILKLLCPEDPLPARRDPPEAGGPCQEREEHPEGDNSCHVSARLALCPTSNVATKQTHNLLPTATKADHFTIIGSTMEISDK
jgi:hypothetical protein